MSELPPDLYAQIQQLSSEGDALAQAGKFEEAISIYNRAWMLVPEPKQRWTVSTWLMAAIGDAAFLGGFGGSALDAFSFAMHCPDGIGNPFLHLRLGQVLFDRDQPDAAANELARAFMGAGSEIFTEEDPKYLAFLATRMDLSPST